MSFVFLFWNWWTMNLNVDHVCKPFYWSMILEKLLWRCFFVQNNSTVVLLFFGVLLGIFLQLFFIWFWVILLDFSEFSYVLTYNLLNRIIRLKTFICFSNYHHWFKEVWLMNIWVNVVRKVIATSIGCLWGLFYFMFFPPAVKPIIAINPTFCKQLTYSNYYIIWMSLLLLLHHVTFYLDLY